MRRSAPPGAREIAAGLEYRDFITVGLLYRRLMRDPAGSGPMNLVPDNWIYIQEPGVKVGRLQIFNNWSPYMVADPATVWIGMEYFCREGDDALDDVGRGAASARRATRCEQIGIIADARTASTASSSACRRPIPATSAPTRASTNCARYLDRFANLFLVGRNGMHRYNNQDHSMLTAKKAVEAIVAGSSDKSAIWAVNIDDEYHEEVAKG